MTREDETPTIPPPPGGDAYSAETTVRQAPEELLEAIRKNKDGAVVALPPTLASDPASLVRADARGATRRARPVTVLALAIALVIVAAALGRHLVGW